MTDPPYTDADLRIEAARQHAVLTDDPEYMETGEMMVGTPITSRAAEPRSGWHDLDDLEGDAFSEAQRKINDLINYAADVSGWAVDLGADGLEPCPDSLCVDNDAEGTPFVRLHFAFRPDAPRAAQLEFMLRVASLLETMENHRVTLNIRARRP